MRKYTILLLILFFIALGFAMIEHAFSPASPLLVHKPPEPAEKSVEAPKIIDRFGEKITYDVLLGNIKIGQALFTNKAKVDYENRKANLVVLETKLARFVDTETIYCDPETFLPLRIERQVLAWPKKESIVEEYDQKAFTLVVTKLRNRNEDKKINFKKDGPIHNAVILPYYVRQAGELANGWNMTANLPSHVFEIRLTGMEDLKLPSGQIKAYHFISEPRKFEFWVSADEKRIPLKIKGTHGLGYIMLMKEYSYDGM